MGKREVLVKGFRFSTEYGEAVVTEDCEWDGTIRVWLSGPFPDEWDNEEDRRVKRAANKHRKELGQLEAQCRFDLQKNNARATCTKCIKTKRRRV